MKNVGLEWTSIAQSIPQWGVLLFITILLLVGVGRFYQPHYTLTKKEKGWILALTLLWGSVDFFVMQSMIPFWVWGLLAYQFVIDRKYMELPDGVNGLIALSAIPSIIVKTQQIGWLDNGVLTGVILFLFFFLLAIIGPMGGGDIKMMGAIGLYFSMGDVLPLLLFGFLIGSLQGIFLILVKKQKKDALFAFGPALILGVLVTIWMKGVGWIV